MRFVLVIVAAAVLGVSGARADVGNMTSHGGPVLRSPNIHLIFWLPPGRHIEPSGDDSRLETRLRETVDNLSGTHYLGVLTQYGGTDQVHFGGLWVDATPYPHAGTETDPLRISDYADAVKRALANNGWQPGLDNVYLVLTANQIEACGLAPLPGGGRDPAHFYTPIDCTFPNVDGNQCNVHSSFTQGGQPVVYAAIPYPAARRCIVDPTPTLDPNHDIPLDTELIAEATYISATVVDPLGNGWYTDNPQTGEINCFGSEYVGDLELAGEPVPVFSLWSNAQHRCAFGYPALATKLTLKAKTVKRRHSQTATVKTVAGASVTLEIDYSNGRFSSRKGIAESGVYRYTWRVPNTRGTAKLIASVRTGDGGEGSARASFRIR